MGECNVANIGLIGGKVEEKAVDISPLGKM